jgi:hypothetical protein
MRINGLSSVQEIQNSIFTATETYGGPGFRADFLWMFPAMKARIALPMTRRILSRLGEVRTAHLPWCCHETGPISVTLIVAMFNLPVIAG